MDLEVEAVGCSDMGAGQAICEEERTEQANQLKVVRCDGDASFNVWV